MPLSSQISPGINVREIDLTQYVPSITVATGGFVGQFNWGPMNHPVMIGSKRNLETRFLPPVDSSLNSFAGTSFLSCLNFLSYPGGNLWVVRASSNNALNSSSANAFYTVETSNTAFVDPAYGGADPTLVLEASIAHPKSYIYFGPDFVANSVPTGLGGLYLSGNNASLIKITDANNVSGMLTLDSHITANVYSSDVFMFESQNTSNTVLIQNEVEYENMYLLDDNNNDFGPFVGRYPGDAGNSLTVSVCTSANNFSNWHYRLYFTNPPGTSDYASRKGSANDEMHIVVVDSSGSFTGTKGTIMEKYSFLSKAFDAIDINGQKSYYKQVLFEQSNHIYAMDPVDYDNTHTTWGRSAKIVKDFAQTENMTIHLANGSNGDIPTSSDLIRGWQEFANKDAFEVNLCFTGDSPIDVHQYLIDNIIEGQNYPITGRRDSMVFISPRYDDVVNCKGFELDNILGETGFLAHLNRQSSYAVVDSGWKYQLDIYNNIYRWVPLNADIAGICAQTDLVAEPWFSPAGMRRGAIKNILKLAWNPARAERDALYQNGVNPVVSFTGTGPLLFGDKTLQAMPTAFDRINVRRLFIVLEKAISFASLNSLFEINDTFTRAQFVAMVEPYLRSIKAKRGIYDYLVVCDLTNNTPDIIDSNGFVGDIYVKPAKSINFIQLNFIAVASSVQFNTVVGQF